jgi:hypothetical protein
MNARGALRLLGMALASAALVWIGWRFVEKGGIELIRNVPLSRLQLLELLLAGSIGYAIAMCLLAFTWWRLLVGVSSSAPAPAPTMATYAVSQYAKYLPGNVAHYALRHALSRREGTPHASLALAAALEAALLLLAAFLLTLAVDLRAAGPLSFIDPRIAIGVLILVLALAWLALRWMQRRGHIGRLQVPALPPAMFLQCLPAYLAFFVLCATLQAGLAFALGIQVPSYAMLVAATAGSWLAGFVIIGAPAGLGVREAAFVALAGASLGEGHALLLIGLFRVVTFAGDTLFLATGVLLARIIARASAAER